MKYEELSQIFASLLTKPAEEIAGYYLVIARKEFENLQLEYLGDNDYTKAREQLYAEKVKLIKEYKGELNFDVTKYLKSVLEVALPIAVDKAKYKEAYEPGLLSLLRWYHDDITPNYKVVYGPGVDDTINNYTIVAEANGRPPITFEFKYLKQIRTLPIAAELWATIEVLKEEQSIANTPNNDGKIIPKWNADAEMLVQIFKILRDRSQKDGSRAIVTTDENLISVLNENFVDANGRRLFPSQRKKDYDKIGFNCHAKTLVFLFTYLTFEKIDSEKSITYLSAEEGGIKTIMSNCFIPLSGEPVKEDSIRSNYQEFVNGANGGKLEQFTSKLANNKYIENYIPYIKDVLIAGKN